MGCKRKNFNFYSEYSPRQKLVYWVQNSRKISSQNKTGQGLGHIYPTITGQKRFVMHHFDHVIVLVRLFKANLTF